LSLENLKQRGCLKDLDGGDNNKLDLT
jgi:hypothetical protein